jgi:SAM-dependent methyltransferase
MTAESPYDRAVDDGAGRRLDFSAVDRGETAELVVMMEATDAWPAVAGVRAWVLEQTGVGSEAIVVDAGCGPGTFGSAVAATGAVAVDVDTSVAMLEETRRRRLGARPVLGDVARLPLRTGAAQLVRAERILQWTPDPYAALAELRRVTAPGGWTAVTDTDWGTLAVDHPDPQASERLAAAALRWVPHPRFANALAEAMSALGPTDLRERADTVVITAWDPDDPAQHAGPPGLPLRSLVAAAAADRRRALEHDLAVLADDARDGGFNATLTIVTVAARRA